jgi:hypothetical protein
MYALDLDFSLYQQLLKRLETTYPIEMLNQNKGAIKQAIIDHFAETDQVIMLSVYKDHITVKKEFIDETRDEQYDRSLHACTIRLLAILSDPDTFRSSGILWIIPSEIRQELYTFYQTGHVDEEGIKHELRLRIEQLFGLDEHEIVLFLRQRIYIRKSVAIPNDRQSKERRFAGRSPEVMQEHCKEHFPDGAWADIEEILPDTMQDRLDLTAISNRRFIKTFVPVFRAMVEIVVLEKLGTLQKDDLLAFSGYILRNHFDAILRYVAIDLLGHIESRDKNAENFIKYYNGEIVIDDEGNKIVHHAILDSEGQKWNYSSILSILIQWKEAKNRARHQDEKVRELLERQKAAEASLERAEPKRAQADKAIDALKKQVNANREAFKRLKADGKSPSQDHQAHRNMLIKLRDEDRRLVELLRKSYEEHDADLRAYDNALKAVNSWRQQASSNAKQLKEIHEQNKVIKKNHNQIIKALITVLAKR